MKPIEILQGKWLGHPLHPALVHVPVGAWLAACLLDVINRYSAQSGSWSRLALYLVVGGIVVALPAAATGIADWSQIKRSKPAWKIGLAHMALTGLTALLWCGNAGLRWQRLDTAEPISAAVLLTSLAATALLCVSAYLGKLMVFDQGTNIARASKPKWRAIAERGGGQLPPEK